MSENRFWKHIDYWGLFSNSLKVISTKESDKIKNPRFYDKKMCQRMWSLHHLVEKFKNLKTFRWDDLLTDTLEIGDSFETRLRRVSILRWISFEKCWDSFETFLHSYYHYYFWITTKSSRQDNLDNLPNKM